MFVKTPPTTKIDDETLDSQLRPKTWDEYIGQDKVKQKLSIIIEAAKKRGEPVEHLLFYGNSGLGKTTLAHVISNVMGRGIKTCSGPMLEKTGDLASLLTNLQDGEVLFVDECHRIQRLVAEMLYSALEDFKLHLILGKGPMARTMELAVPRFTFIGATTRLSLLPSPFRNRFGGIFQLDFYTKEDLEKIIGRSAKILNIAIDQDALGLLAARSRFTPRIANRLLKRVRDFATVEGSELVTKEIADKGLELLEVDESGLEPEDRKILRSIIERFGGGPVGIKALASSVAEEPETILDIYEPYLMQLGFLKRTPQGRVATSLAYKHLGITQKQKDLI